jgi:hypothetical protein
MPKAAYKTHKFVRSTYFGVDPTEAFSCNLNTNEDRGEGPVTCSWENRKESWGYTVGVFLD